MWQGGKVVCAGLALLLLGAGCAPQAVARYGLTYSPRGMEAATKEDGQAFFQEAKSFGGIVAFHTNWRDTPQKSGEVPVVAQVAAAARKQYGVTPSLGFGWTVGERLDVGVTTGGPNDWTDPAAREHFKSMVVTYATTSQPPYLFLGNEVNMWVDRMSPASWQAWVALFAETADAVRAASPKTKVFTTFQLERLKGVGKNNGWQGEAQWDLVGQFAPHADALGFTTYPFFEYDDPAEIPADYYSDILTHQQAGWPDAVAFTEIGWKATTDGPYKGSPVDQEVFVSRFGQLTASLPLLYATWAFLYDPPHAASPFAGTGLRSETGEVRPAEAAWQAWVASDPVRRVLP